MDQPIYPPSMSGAGINPPQMPEPTGGYGSMPQAALQQLQGPPMPPMSPPPSMGMGGAYAAAAAGPKALPITQPYNPQINQQNQAQFQQAIEFKERQTDKKFAKDKTLLTMWKDMLDILPEGPGRDSLAKQYAGKFSELSGVPNSGDLAAAIATKKVPVSEVNGILMDKANGMNDSLIQSRHPDVSPQRIQQIIASDPNTIARMGAESQQERAKKKAEAEIKEAEAIEHKKKAETPEELQGDPRFAMMVKRFAKKIGGGKSYNDLTDDQKQQAFEAAETRLREIKNEDAERAVQKSIDMALGKQAAGVGPKKSNMTYKQKQDALNGITKSDNIMDSITELRNLREDLVKDGAFATSDSIAGTGNAWMKMHITKRESSAMKKFRQLWPAFEVGQVSRGLFDEKGARQAAAFANQLDISHKNLPTVKAFDDYLDLIERLVVSDMRKRTENLVTLKADDDVVDRAKDFLAPYAKVEAPQVKKAGPSVDDTLNKLRSK